MASTSRDRALPAILEATHSVVGIGASFRSAPCSEWYDFYL